MEATGSDEGATGIHMEANGIHMEATGSDVEATGSDVDFCTVLSQATQPFGHCPLAIFSVGLYFLLRVQPGQ